MAFLQNSPAYSFAIPSPRDRCPLRLQVADTSATDHILPDKEAFISYHLVANCHIRMSNYSFAPILGTGSAVIDVNSKWILIQDAFMFPL
jgi:hypothetical protein